MIDELAVDDNHAGEAQRVPCVQHSTNGKESRTVPGQEQVPEGAQDVEEDLGGSLLFCCRVLGSGRSKAIVGTLMSCRELEAGLAGAVCVILYVCVCV
jgi:hypothetical protein